MTHEEMNDVIQKYCEEIYEKNADCVGCAIEEVCEAICGVFSADKDACREAYKILTRNNEAVDHPSHYNQGKYECIEVMIEVFGIEAVKHFCLLNAFKYNWRTGEKNGNEDIEKGIWYLNKYLELATREVSE